MIKWAGIWMVTCLPSALLHTILLQTCLYMHLLHFVQPLVVLNRIQISAPAGGMVVSVSVGGPSRDRIAGLLGRKD